jgi:hypothetical protein
MSGLLDPLTEKEEEYCGSVLHRIQASLMTVMLDNSAEMECWVPPYEWEDLIGELTKRPYEIKHDGVAYILLGMYGRSVVVRAKRDVPEGRVHWTPRT